MSVPTRPQLEARIASASQRRECVIVGHANTAIHLALEIIRERVGPGEIIVPCITCVSVIEVICNSGFTPVYADVTLPDCTIDVHSAAALISSRTRAILPIHIFGNPAPIETIRNLARKARVAVIEDVAQATGGVISGRKLGSFGDFAVHSFGAGKILDAGGGGALVTDDVDAARRARAIVSTMPPLTFGLAASVKSLSHRNLYHGYTDLLRVDPSANVSESSRAILPLFRDLYLHSLPESAPTLTRISKGLEELAANLAHRRLIAAFYHTQLSRLSNVLQLSDGWMRSAVVWRYTFLVRDATLTVGITHALRRVGVQASNHYWSVAALIDNRRVYWSDYASARVLNLWVDRTTSLENAARAVEVIQELFEHLG